jgi:exodeoxyribonuclease-1
MAEPFSFFWHDYETFGRVPRRDRPAQFAGVRTDAALNEIAASVVHYCQPAPDYLPEPEACLLTGIVPQVALQRGLPEHRFAAAVEAELATPGTVGAGYNSIRFDDEVTRHLFWRNLIDPYAREWRNGCGRWDLLDVVRCARALRPDGIEWPRHADGRASFRLEDLSAANGIAHTEAHDALADVRATLALARRVREQHPRLWDFCLRLRRKEAVLAEIGAGDAPFLHVSGMFPAERGCLAIVWPLGPHPTNRNELIVWDLDQDPQELAGLDAASVRERLFVRAEELADGQTRLPIKTIHVNKSPIVIGNIRTLDATMAERWGIDVARALRHAEVARTLPAQPKAYWEEVFAREPRSDVDVDQDLYGGFIGDEDRRRLERLRALAPEQVAARLPSFDDPRLDEIVFRWRARNFPATLDVEESQRWEAHRAAVLHGGLGGGLTLAAYLEQIDRLAEAAADRGDERAETILAALVDYAEAIAPDDVRTCGPS